MYKSCFLGCGGRSRGHAGAYKYVTKGELVAVCDQNEELLNARGEDYGIEKEKRYTDYHEMLDKEQPDLLHIVTAPICMGEPCRVKLMKIASEHEVPVAIVEKPIAIQGEDWKQLKELNENSNTKFVVNTQLHFHPRNLELKRDVAEGKIGDIRFIDVSARSTVTDQGVHVLELADSYNGYAAPVKVIGNVFGAGTIGGRQPSPDGASASVEFENDVYCQMLNGEVAPKTNEGGGRCSHKRISVYGTRGFVQWTMHGWERSTPDGGHESGSHSYGAENVRGQAKLTDAAFEWAENDDKPHPTRLEHSLTEFNIILGMYVSALNNAPVSLPLDPPDGLTNSLKERLS